MLTFSGSFRSSRNKPQKCTYLKNVFSIVDSLLPGDSVAFVLASEKLGDLISKSTSLR